MPLAAAAEYEAMLDAAAADGFALPAVNVTSSLTLNAALRGLAEAGSDGIVQITIGASSYLSGAGVGDPFVGATAFAQFAHVVAEASPVLVALHTDHGSPDHVDDVLRPLIAASAERVSHGDPPLFHSHMFDGSRLPLEQNLELSADLLEACSRAGLVLEIECGVVGGSEDGISGPDGRSDELYTAAEDLLRVADALGTGEKGRYLVAATFGNVHGTYAPDHVLLRPEILREGQRALQEARSGSRFQYVFHGGSGSAQAEIEAAVDYGVVKFNVDTDAQYAFTRGVAGHLLDHWKQALQVDGVPAEKAAFDPRAWGAVGEAAMAARVASVCRGLGSAGRSLASHPASH
jgi:fructose-bisphosphate aldolase class II